MHEYCYKYTMFSITIYLLNDSCYNFNLIDACMHWFKRQQQIKVLMGLAIPLNCYRQTHCVYYCYIKCWVVCISTIKF